MSAHPHPPDQLTDPGRPAPTPGDRREVVASAEDLTKVYGSGRTEVRAVSGVSLSLHRGSFTAVMGQSGSGKSTLMHCLAGLDRITSGRVFLGGHELSRLNDKQLTLVRRDKVGFVFQSFNLLPTLTAQQNIELPLDLAGRRVDPDHFRSVVDALGLGDRLRHRPSELSGGQQQRVAIARALLTRPDVLFADEPTGALDSATGEEVLAHLRHSADELDQTVVMVTHDAQAASWADRVLLMADGHLVDDLDSPSREQLLELLNPATGTTPRRRGPAGQGRPAVDEGATA
ncbi:ABC transporter ATP-binding protein [Auraticoccus monumenti]|uniref:Putative ABC transport system ATP-binding protein n=1 Tax=Auraticoccus monumenti TaxID=675864 RepID=A0A1G6TT80_9ACTN|nr:ABC transporter ATP-binding protein [Auraticoccus monumenti]SDD31666.1 putative ABC transport system ATP-binding protein [Auraticoccus monumenti]